MPRPSSDTLTPRETEIMMVLWERGEATADEVRTALAGDPHDSTVRTLLRVLETKRYVRHEVRGKVYVYGPAVSREQVESRELDTFLQRIFRGSARALLQRLIEDEHLTAKELADLPSPPRPRRKKAAKGRTRRRKP